MVTLGPKQLMTVSTVLLAMSTAGLITGLVFLQVIDCTRLLFCLSKLSLPLLSHAATLMLLRAVTFSSVQRVPGPGRARARAASDVARGCVVATCECQ